MDLALATVTVISLTMAFAMGVVTWRLMREERRRSDAHVATLLAELERPREPTLGAVERVALDAPRVAAPVRTAESAPPRRQATPATPAVGPARSAGTVTPPVPVAQSPTGLFATMTGSPVSLRPFLATLAAAVAVVAAVSVTMLSGLSGGPLADPGSGTPGPVELLSLTHAREGEYLAITGSIRNPSDGIERGQLSVTATVFDRDGTVVGTAQTPLPVAVLAPGRETPFTISLPDADRINRYRISFMEGQTSVPHIDRRRPNDQARSVAPAPTGDRP
ncbi:MAG: hypothetical protein IH939_00490 [Acidobacteria bacterium]|nr:hypothetical protein [Acidobacteriota bacterium]